MFFVPEAAKFGISAYSHKDWSVQKEVYRNKRLSTREDKGVLASGGVSNVGKVH